MINDPRSSGPWTSEMYSEHLPDDIAFDEKMAESLISIYRPQKSLDLGCGLGYYVKFLRDQKIDAWGVEAEDLDESFKAPGYQIKKDLSEPFDLQEKYDLVMCLEVVEHIPRDFEDIVFDNIVRHMSKYLLFSGATVGQQGTGHINERHEKHWFGHLTKRGLVLLHQQSLKIRSACTLPWYANNVSIWELTTTVNSNHFAIIAEQDSFLLSQEATINQMESNINGLQQTLQLQQAELEQAQSALQLQQAELEQAQSALQLQQAELERRSSICITATTSGTRTSSNCFIYLSTQSAWKVA